MNESVLSDTMNATNEALKIAKNCRHYAMCKIDFLGNGICASGLERQYASFLSRRQNGSLCGDNGECSPDH